MLKKLGLASLVAAAGMLSLGGVASADTPEYDDQVGLVNLNNIDVLHNVNGTVGLCGNEVNVLGVQVSIHDALNGIGVPVLSPGDNEASGENPYNCASGGVVDGGSVQDN
ncbi:hypothetical protein [Amycolatopsis magusensis]|uniref:Secreted protein n=1 Tax=Amycolatopsis magusensis TaxID=882444 RepID=A0ABS4Q5P8_9PSEU|nr:hypothetical protein [Amycolatopsis magusensis]MBP2187005.1 hypothetical protein [Amycolatopsis magusensis]MDI5979287.1 hypothetical protein [Amycolatopsis magusensis]